MVPIYRLEQLPDNWPHFVSESTLALKPMYSQSYAATYESMITPAFRVMLANRTLVGWGTGNPGETRGMCTATMRGTIGVVSWIHILKPYRGQRLEAELVRTATAYLQQRACEPILIDAIPLFEADLDETTAELGFQRWPRELMLAESDRLGIADSGFHRRISRRELKNAANMLVETYAEHPGRSVHPEVQSERAALQFLTSTWNGSYGATFPHHIQVAYDGNSIAGFVAGASAGGDIAYLFHIAVAPRRQRQSIGTRLLQSFAQAAADAGFRYVALGVNAGNPAISLYRKLGFQTRKTMAAYVWRQDRLC